MGVAVCWCGGRAGFGRHHSVHVNECVSSMSLFQLQSSVLSTVLDPISTNDDAKRLQVLRWATYFQDLAVECQVCTMATKSQWSMHCFSDQRCIWRVCFADSKEITLSAHLLYIIAA